MPLDLAADSLGMGGGGAFFGSMDLSSSHLPLTNQCKAINCVKKRCLDICGTLAQSAEPDSEESALSGAFL